MGIYRFEMSNEESLSSLSVVFVGFSDCCRCGGVWGIFGCGFGADLLEMVLVKLVVVDSETWLLADFLLQSRKCILWVGKVCV